MPSPTGNLTIDVKHLMHVAGFGTLFASLPTPTAVVADDPGNVGQICIITDGGNNTVGATATGSGSHVNVLICTGAAWKIVASLS